MKYFEIPLSDFTTTDGKRNKLASMQEVSEWVFDFAFNQDGGAYDISIEDCCYDIADAYTYISKETGVPVHELRAKYKEQVERDFRQSLADSFRASYEYEWEKRFYSLMQENIKNALGSLYDSAYFVYKDKDKVHKIPVSADYSKLGYCDEARVIRIYATKEQMADFLRCKYNQYSWGEYVDEVLENIYPKNVDTEYVDYYGTLGDSDEWFLYFKDYEEVSLQVKKNIEKRARRTKAYITHNVPLIYRTA